MFDRLILNRKKKRVHAGIKRIKELISKDKLYEAKNEYDLILGEYNIFCKKATYAEKISLYHTLSEGYDMLKKKSMIDQKPAEAKSKADVIEEKKETVKKIIPKNSGKKKSKISVAAKNKAGKSKKPGKNSKNIAKKDISNAESAIKQEEEKLPEPAREISHKSCTPNTAHLKTVLDDLYNLVQEKGSVSIVEISSRFKVSRDMVEEWAKILEQSSLIKIYYPAFSSAHLQSIEWSEKQDKKKGHESKAEEK